MKLLSKTLFYYVLISLPILVIAGFLSYFSIKAEFREGTDEILVSEKLQAEKLVQSLKTTLPIYLGIDSLSTIKLLLGAKLKAGYSDTLIFNALEDENISARMLRTYYSFNGRTFQITLVKSTMEEEELLESMVTTFTIIITLLILAFVIVNWLLSKTLWKPFYKTLSQLQKYDLKSHSIHLFGSENTTEFNQLNAALNKMTNKIYSDYLQQKEFTENASHEMQTPLAIVKANLSLLMQSPRLKEQEMQQLQTIENTIKKLSSLNKALLLLSKIENNQFAATETINFSALVMRMVANFEEVIASKALTLSCEKKENAFVKMNTVLAEVLITNLLQNAIRHNEPGGKIVLQCSANEFEILNTGQTLSIPEVEMFIRFKKNDASKESLGLGLSIVDGIAKIYGFKIYYTYSNALHSFKVIFS